MLIPATGHPNDKHNLKLRQRGSAWTEDSSKTIQARRACTVERPFYIHLVAKRGTMIGRNVLLMKTRMSIQYPVRPTMKHSIRPSRVLHVLDRPSSGARIKGHKTAYACIPINQVVYRMLGSRRTRNRRHEAVNDW